MSDSKLEFYMQIISKSNEAFKDFLSHLPEDMLDWKIHKFIRSPRHIISQLLYDQIWFAKFIVINDSLEYDFSYSESKKTVEEFVESFNKTVVKASKIFSKLQETDLSRTLNHKGYTQLVEDVLFEYNHHLNMHSGQLSMILHAHKRKNRSLEED